MKYITVFATFLFTFIAINAQDLGQQVMLKGKVVDVNTNKPLSIEIEFQPKVGSKSVVKSAEGTGTFEQLLQANEEYELTFKGDNIYREEDTYTPKSNTSDGYSEIAETFKVKGLAPGVEVESLDIFAANSTDITSAGKAALNKMKISMRFNRNADFIFQVNAPTKALADKRLNTLKDFISDWRRLLDRVEFQSSTKGNTLNIIVSKVEDIFK